MYKLLPLVDSEVGFSIANSLGDEYDPKTWRAQYQHIKKVNPTVAEFIAKWSKLAGKKGKLHAAICGILVYRLLESQAEVNQMYEDIKLGD
jgi:hypothetical protein